MWIRIPAFLLALLVAAWFGLGAVQARDTDRATAVLTSQARITAAQAREIDGWLNSAGVLNPDRTVTLLRGRAAMARGDRGRARSLFESVVRAEPQNLEAWVALAQAASSAAQFRAALDRARSLEPLIPGQRS